MYFSFPVGQAREMYGVKAPAVSGDPIFERYYRVQQNTLEQLIVFLPATVAFSYTAEVIGWPGYYIATGLGIVWVVGRYLYFKAYIENPSKRMTGFLLTFLPNVLMVVGTLVCLVISAAQQIF